MRLDCNKPVQPIKYLDNLVGEQNVQGLVIVYYIHG